MAHSVGEQAARAVKNSEKKSAAALRTPEERMSAIRGSIAAKLFVIPDDVKFLLGAYDELLLISEKLNQAMQQATQIVETQDAEIVTLRAQIEWIRHYDVTEQPPDVVSADTLMKTRWYAGGGQDDAV